MAMDSSQEKVFETAAQLFALLSTPMRLKIISAVCEQERNVTELLAQIGTSQSNMSQHLATLHKSGVLSRRRQGAQIYYGLQNERVSTLCRAVCTQVAIDMDDDTDANAKERLVSVALVR